MEQNLYLILLIPLLAFFIILLFGAKIPKLSAWISIFAALFSFSISVPVILATFQNQIIHIEWVWIYFGEKPLKMGLIVDSLSAMMLFVVTFISSLIQIYSLRYMHGDTRYSKYFAYLSLFLFSMLLVILADNLLLVFVGWELMGLCSYLLIGFWFERPAAVNAGKKAFIINRIGNVGFLIAIIWLYSIFGTFQFHELNLEIAQYIGPSLALMAILLFSGAIGKSAQFPLHVWLPNAKDCPTPVLALIHASTMVAAGVYMLARTFFIFQNNPDVMQMIAYIGGFTAFMAATIAITQNNIKQVLAYSTLSQLGYMIMALGLGGYISGSFHLMTHAFFKTLLFLGAGSVIYGTRTQDIREMGGLLKTMPVTGWTFLIGTMAIAGVPPLSGFWSKNEILLNTYNSPITGHIWLFWIGIFTAFLTAYYMFRLFFMIFLVEPCKTNIQPQESPAIMTYPLIILALFSIIIGLPGSPIMEHAFQNWLNQSFYYAEDYIFSPNYLIMLLFVMGGLVGIWLARAIYIKKLFSTDIITHRFHSLYHFLHKKWYFDEIYQLLIVQPFFAATTLLYAFDVWIIDGTVKGIARRFIQLSKFNNLIDIYIVDGLVNLTGWLIKQSSRFIRLVQTGLVQNYLLLLLFGLAILIWYKILENMKPWLY